MRSGPANVASLPLDELAQHTNRVPRWMVADRLSTPVGRAQRKLQGVHADLHMVALISDRARPQSDQLIRGSSSVGHLRVRDLQVFATIRVLISLCCAPNIPSNEVLKTTKYRPEL